MDQGYIIYLSGTVDGYLRGKASFNSFRRWLGGSFVCRKCGLEYHTMCFGFGEAICPKCYRGEQPFIFFDGSYWLNRFTASLLKQESPPREPQPYDLALVPMDLTSPVVEM